MRKQELIETLNKVQEKEGGINVPVLGVVNPRRKGRTKKSATFSKASSDDRIASLIDQDMKEICANGFKMWCDEYRPESASQLVRLKKENTALRFQLSSLQEKHDRVLEERDSLDLAVKLISKDLENANPYVKTPHDNDDIKQQEITITPPIEDKEQSQEQSERKKTRADKQKRRKPAANGAPKTTGDKAVRSDAPDESNLPDPGAGSDQPRPALDKKLMFIAGDSIIQHVQGWNLSTSDRLVAVKSFAGDKVEDMDDF